MVLVYYTFCIKVGIGDIPFQSIPFAVLGNLLLAYAYINILANFKELVVTSSIYLLLGDVSALIGFPQSCDASGTIVGILLCSFFGTADNKAFAIGPLEFMADIVPFVQ